MSVDPDELLEALGAAAREGEPDDDSWRTSVRFAAGQGPPPNDPERHEAMAPLDVEALTDAVLDTRRRRPTSGRGRSRWATASAVIALAAAVALIVVPKPGSEPVALPAYTMAVEGGDQVERGDARTDEVRRLAPGSRLSIVLRPDQAGATPLVSLFLASEGRRVPWSVVPEQAPGGAVRIAGSTEALFGERRGRWRLEIELRGTPDASPDFFSVDVVLPGNEP